jgi:alpha-glucan,water dikinase
MDREEKILTNTGVHVTASVQELDDGVEVILSTDKKCVLHWGVSSDPHGPWRVPPRGYWPEGSRAFDSSALQTPFDESTGRTIRLKLEKPVARWLNFVLFFPDEGRWDNNNGNNYRMEIPAPEIPASELSPDTSQMARLIIEKETGRQSWTLMHRFTLCSQLLDKVSRGDIEGLSLLFVWLRFSSLRQLDWQRNFNTKPSELGHAMDQLTLKLAARYAEASSGERQILRLMMTALGRGSNAQRVRDEVLNIMHRHNIKEVSGHFMEEWHQKLHNNTTPDDVIICEAYLEFLRSNGDLSLFYRNLEEGGVTRERLRSYERPITSDPDFIPRLKDALIADFERFLGTRAPTSG